MSAVEVRAKDFYEASERRLTRLTQMHQADPEDPAAWLDVILEQARNRTLQLVLGHPDDPSCEGIGN